MLDQIRRLVWPEAPPPPPYDSFHPAQRAEETVAVKRLRDLEQRLRVAESRVGIAQRGES